MGNELVSLGLKALTLGIGAIDGACENSVSEIVHKRSCSDWVRFGSKGGKGWLAYASVALKGFGVPILSNLPSKSSASAFAPFLCLVGFSARFSDLFSRPLRRRVKLVRPSDKSFMTLFFDVIVFSDEEASTALRVGDVLKESSGIALVLRVLRELFSEEDEVDFEFFKGAGAVGASPAAAQASLTKFSRIPLRARAFGKASLGDFNAAFSALITVETRTNALSTYQSKKFKHR